MIVSFLSLIFVSSVERAEIARSQSGREKEVLQ